MHVVHQIQSSAVFFQFRGKGNASLKQCDTKQEVKAKETDMRGRKRVTVTQGEGLGEGIVRELGMDMVHTAIFKVDNQQGPIV